jgi:hypothetical protein
MTPETNRLHQGMVFIALILSLFLFASLSTFAQEAEPGAPGSEFVAPYSAPAPAAHYPPNTDTVSYWYGSNYRTPFVLKPGTFEAANIPRNSIEYKHVDFWQMGSNFADVTLAKSSMAEPSTGGGNGAVEAYAIFRSTFGLNQITGTRAFQFGPVRNVALEVGANLETKNSSFAPSERTIYFGPNVEFAVPRGYFNLGLHLRKEWNHEGVLGLSEDYDPDFNIEPTWMFPFTLGKAHLAYSGFAEYNTAKGTDSFGTPSVPEFLFRSAVSVDLGSLMFKRAQLVELNGGLWYWHNEYGKPASEPGAKQATPIIGLTFHLDGGRSLDGK